jgi:ubiquinone/menaquinone biosynthesis C-methylase UbiE
MFLKPEQTIGLLDLREGMYVADLGCGSGFYTMLTSKKVGINGKVYAIEVQKDYLKKLESEIKEYNISNVECVWGDIEKINGTKLANESMDAVIVSNVLFQVEDKLGLIDEVKRILKKNGKVLVIDLEKPLGGDDKRDHYIVNQQEAENLFNKRGFIVLDKISTLPHHYGIIFKHE